MEMWVNSDFSMVMIKDSQGICCASFSKPVTLATMIHSLQATQNPKDQVRFESVFVHMYSVLNESLPLCSLMPTTTATKQSSSLM